MSEVSWNKIFDSNLNDLTVLEKQVDPNSEKGIYILALRYYLSGNTEELRDFVTKINKLSLSEELQKILEIRVAIRERKITSQQLEHWSLATEGMADFWKGEFFFSLGIAAGLINVHEQAVIFFKKAFNYMIKADVYQKALKSYLNAIAAYENLKPNHLTLANFHYFLSIAKKIQSTENQGMAYLNMSYQFQKMGCLNKALRFADIAIEMLGNSKDEVQYQLALAQQTELMIRAEKKDSIESLSFLRDSKHKAIQEIYKYLIKRYQLKGANDCNLSKENLPHSWKSRTFDYSYGKEKFSELEESLIFLLSDGEKSVGDLAEEIYRDDVSSLERKMAKVRSLIDRVQKKNRNLVKRSRENYFILVNNKVFDEIVMPNEFVVEISKANS